MLDGEGHPRFIPANQRVTLKPLSQSVSLLLGNEGEGDRTREWWLDAHRRYFARQATREGFEMDDEILAVFERFEVVWPLDVAMGSTGRLQRRPDEGQLTPGLQHRTRIAKAADWHTISTTPSVPFLKWSYKKRCTNAIVGVPIGGSWLWRVKGSSWLRKRLKN